MPFFFMPKHLTLAIDCGEHSGIAVYNSVQKCIIETKNTDFFGAISFVKTFERESVVIIVEVPSDFIYARNSFQKGAVRDKMAINIGMNRREAQLIAEACRRLGFETREVLPVRAAKWTAEQLKRELGIEARTSQHVRDAARLAYFYSNSR